MKRYLPPLLLALLPLITGATLPVDSLWNEFVTPADSSRTKLWWFHGETSTTRYGIDADLKAFKDKGIGGVVFYDQVHSKAEGACESMSAEWWEMLKYAAMRAKDLGLTFEVAASNGYVAGGPWITPGLSMKKTVCIDSLITVTGSDTLCLDLRVSDPHFRPVATVIFPDDTALSPIRHLQAPVTVACDDTIISLPAAKATTIRGIQYSVTPRGKGSTGSMNIPGRAQPRYFGAKYSEYPPLGELEYSSDGRVWHKAADLLPVESNIGHKSRVRTISFPAVTGNFFRLRLHDWRGDDPDYKSFTISDITLFRRDITDNIEVMTGLRTEVTYPSATGAAFGAIAPESIRIADVAPDSIGIVKIVPGPGTWHIVCLGYVPTGARTKHGRRNLLGREADVMSAKAADIHYDNYFKAILDTLTGIGCKPAGMCMDSHEAGIQNWTDGFETIFSEANGYDLRPMIPAFAGYIVGSRETTDRFLFDFRKTVARTIADNFYGQLARRCQADSVQYTSQAMLNILNDNIASRGRASKPQGEFWAYQTNGNYDCLDAASAAHLYGRNIASGEAFTDTPYSTSMDELLRIANIAYCRGINEFAVCASSYQPYSDRKYDDSLSLHPYVFHRFHPDWETSRRFWDYQARCAAMLRKGVPVVDLCVYLGDDPPLKTMSYKLPVIPEGYNFDVCTSDALLNRMSAAPDSGINVEGGMKYKALIVQDRSYISPEAETAIENLRRAGAVIIRCDKGETVAERLAAEGIGCDASISSAGLPDDVTLFFHRKTDDYDIYFIYNHSNHEVNQPLRLRQSFDRAERWDPYNVVKETVIPVGDREIPLSLKPYESCFIVLSNRLLK